MDHFNKETDTMKHAATKTAYQCYSYRGQRIEAIIDCDDKVTHWAIYEGEDLIPADAASTLKECKKVIDRGIDAGHYS